MTLLKPATNQTAFLKMGIFGFQGSGKTYTASRIMTGVLRYAKVRKPVVAIFDTEKSSDFLVRYFQEVGVELLAVKSRAFRDLITAIREAEAAGVSGFIVDSATHVWRDLMDSYLKKSKRDFLTMADWGPIKDEWHQLTKAFINSPMHFITIGRAGYEWAHEENESGKKELTKVGTKMKAEGEFGYESDVLIEMERLRIEEKKKGGDVHKDIHRAWILKDRWDLIDGKCFDDPDANTFRQVFALLNLGGEHFGVGDADSQEIFGDPDWSYHEQKKLREIALEELEATLIKLDLSGTKEAVKKARVEALENAFGTSSKAKIETLWAPEIEKGIAKLIGQFMTPPPPADDATAEKGDKTPVEASNPTEPGNGSKKTAAQQGGANPVESEGKTEAPGDLFEAAGKKKRMEVEAEASK